MGVFHAIITIHDLPFPPQSPAFCYKQEKYIMQQSLSSTLRRFDARKFIAPKCHIIVMICCQVSCMLYCQNINQTAHSDSFHITVDVGSLWHHTEYIDSRRTNRHKQTEMSKIYISLSVYKKKIMQNSYGVPSCC